VKFIYDIVFIQVGVVKIFLEAFFLKAKDAFWVKFITGAIVRDVKTSSRECLIC
jgi:hypothetical protein